MAGGPRVRVAGFHQGLGLGLLPQGQQGAGRHQDRVFIPPPGIRAAEQGLGLAPGQFRLSIAKAQGGQAQLSGFVRVQGQPGLAEGHRFGPSLLFDQEGHQCLMDLPIDGILGQGGPKEEHLGGTILAGNPAEEDPGPGWTGRDDCGGRCFKWRRFTSGFMGLEGTA